MAKIFGQLLLFDGNRFLKFFFYKELTTWRNCLNLFNITAGAESRTRPRDFKSPEPAKKTLPVPTFVGPGVFV